VRKTAYLVLLIALVFASLLAAEGLATPPTDEDLVSCQQFQNADGTCTTICVFYGPKGDPTGYARWESCS